MYNQAAIDLFTKYYGVEDTDYNKEVITRFLTSNFDYILERNRDHPTMVFVMDKAGRDISITDAHIGKLLSKLPKYFDPILINIDKQNNRIGLVSLLTPEQIRTASPEVGYLIVDSNKFKEPAIDDACIDAIWEQNLACCNENVLGGTGFALEWEDDSLHMYGRFYLAGIKDGMAHFSTKHPVDKERDLEGMCPLDEEILQDRAAIFQIF